MFPDGDPERNQPAQTDEAPPGWQAPPLWHRVDVAGDAEARDRWAEAARLEGFRVTEVPDLHGVPALCAFVAPSAVPDLAATLRLAGVSGTVTPLALPAPERVEGAPEALTARWCGGAERAKAEAARERLPAPPPPEPAREAKKQPRPNELDARHQHILERRLDDLEERCSFSGDEMDMIWAGVFPEGASPPTGRADVVVGARARDRIRHVLKLAKRAADPRRSSGDRCVPLAEWQSLSDELFWVRQYKDRVVVTPRALQALEKMMAVCDARRDLVLDLDRLEALLWTVLPERYWGPAREALRPSGHAPATAQRVRCMRRRHYYQRCLWHPQDAGNFEQEPAETDDAGRRLGPEGGAGHEGGCELGCGSGAGKKKRHAARPRTVQERIDAGATEAPPDYTQNMLRLEDCFLPPEEDYDPAQYLLRDKGDGGEGGEGKTAHKEAS
jgi:hypothetical protein